MKISAMLFTITNLSACLFSCNTETAMTGASNSNKVATNPVPSAGSGSGSMSTSVNSSSHPPTGVNGVVSGISKSESGGSKPAEESALSTVDVGPLVKTSLNLNCKQVAQSQESPIVIHRKSGQDVELSINGEMCVEIANNLNILFIVDWSNSMTSTDATNLLLSCGRYSAAKAILDYVGVNKQDNDNIKVGFVGFSDRAYDSIMLSYNAFVLAYLNRLKFCYAKAVNGTAGGTNYYAAFTEGESILRSLNTGTKIVYFISDGGPTIRKDGSADFSGSNRGNFDQVAAQDGVNAAVSLRKNIGDLTINGLLLGNEGAAAKQVLVDAIGSADHVRTVNDASEMAAEIMKFPEVPLEPGSAEINMKLGSTSASENLGVKSFAKKNGVRNTWNYSIASTSLTTKSKEDGIRNFTVTVKDANKKSYTSTILVKVVTDP